ncbi:MAG: rhodanese-like domain-containing protein [Crocinitomicaceae bacterium]|nr:rhodanese-like domain-containing protein [Crocinitomicaceae bacterium]
MRFILFFLLIGFNASGQSIEFLKMVKSHYNGFPTITCTEASKKIGNPSILFLDTREEEEFNISHIRGATCVGYDEFSMHSVRLIPKNAEIIVYCSIGARSQDIGEKLKKAGYKNVKNLYGGFFLWNNSGLKKVDSHGNKTDRIHGYSKDWGKWITKGKIVY